MKPILVTTKINTDLDGFASAVAYAEYLNKTNRQARLAVYGDIHDETKYLLDRFGLTYPESVIDPENYDRCVLLDCSNLSKVDRRIDGDKFIRVIDHRDYVETDCFPKAEIEIEVIGACASMIANKFKTDKIKISKSSAILLFAAIISNTMNWQSKVATNKDRAMANWLKTQINLPFGLAEDMFVAKSDLSGGKFKKRILSESALTKIVGKKFVTIQLEIVKAKNFLKKNKIKLLTELDRLNKKFKPDYRFISIIDLTEGFNIFITNDKKTQALLARVLQIKFAAGVAIRPGLILRKEFFPLIKKEFGKN